MKKVLFCVLGFLVILLSGCPNTPAAEKKYAVQLPFIDDFNRADSASVGGSWTESETVSSLCMISNNMLKLTRFSTNYYSLFIKDIKPFGNHKMTMTLSGENTNMDFYIEIINGTSRNGYVVEINNAGVYLMSMNAGSYGGSPQSFTYNQGHAYHISVTATGSMVNLSVSNMNTGTNYSYFIGDNVASSYDFIIPHTYAYSTNAMTVNIDDFSIVEQ